MVLGGAVAIRSDGIDFTALDPELAVGAFLAVPLLPGAVGAAGCALGGPSDEQHPALAIPRALMFPQALPLLVIQLIIVSILLPVAAHCSVQSWRTCGRGSLCRRCSR